MSTESRSTTAAPGLVGWQVQDGIGHKALRWLGVVRAGLSTDRHYPLERYEEHVAATGLVPEARFATWDSEPWEPGRAYAVSVHRRPDQ
jgi:hypothetical protein